MIIIVSKFVFFEKSPESLILFGFANRNMQQNKESVRLDLILCILFYHWCSLTGDAAQGYNPFMSLDRLFTRPTLAGVCFLYSTVCFHLPCAVWSDSLSRSAVLYFTTKGPCAQIYTCFLTYLFFFCSNSVFIYLLIFCSLRSLSSLIPNCYFISLFSIKYLCLDTWVKEETDRSH